MRSSEDLRGLLDHAEWADAAIWRCVLADPAKLYRPRVAEWLHHLHLVQRAFLSLWRGSELETPELDTFDSPRELAEWGRVGHRAIREFLEADEPLDLDRKVEIPWAKLVEKRFGKNPAPVTIGQTAMQVALHSAHHRGQIAAEIRALGGEPPLVDFIAWLWLHRPAAEWPSAGSSPEEREC